MEQHKCKYRDEINLIIQYIVAEVYERRACLR